MAADIDLKIWGIRGGNPTCQDNRAKIVVFINDDTVMTDNFIAVDAFQGQGDSYVRREKTLITVLFKGKQWDGTMNDLATALKLID